MMGDNDFPAVLGGSNPAVGFLQSYVKGQNYVKQSGPDIANFSVDKRYAQERGGPLVSRTRVTA